MTAHRIGAVACAVLLLGCTASAPDAVVDRGVRYSETVELPPPVQDGARSFEEVLTARRSGREFETDPLPATIIGQLLWSAQGITDDAGHRTAPSAGAHYPIEVYAVTSSSVMHYLPDEHAVEQRRDDAAFERLASSSFGQSFVGAAPVVIVLTGVAERTRTEYGAVADDLVNREAGHVAQNVLLQATALDLIAVPVGGFDPASAARALALPPGEEVLYLVPVGTR